MGEINTLSEMIPWGGLVGGGFGVIPVVRVRVKQLQNDHSKAIVCCYFWNILSVVQKKKKKNWWRIYTAIVCVCVCVWASVCVVLAGLPTQSYLTDPIIVGFTIPIVPSMTIVEAGFCTMLIRIVIIGLPIAPVLIVWLTYRNTHIHTHKREEN